MEDNCRSKILPTPFLVILGSISDTSGTMCNSTYTTTATTLLSLLVHTSFSSFTLHLPPSRRDWTSCNCPSAAATSRSLRSEALAAACVWWQKYHSQHKSTINSARYKADSEVNVRTYAKFRWGWGQVHTVIIFRHMQMKSSVKKLLCAYSTLHPSLYRSKS